MTNEKDFGALADAPVRAETEHHLRWLETGEGSPWPEAKPGEVQKTHYCPICVATAKELEALRAEGERLTRERDDARFAAEHWRDLAKLRATKNATLRQELDDLSGEVEVLRAANDGEPWAGLVLGRQRDAALAEVERLRRVVEALPPVLRRAEIQCESDAFNLRRLEDALAALDAAEVPRPGDP